MTNLKYWVRIKRGYGCGTERIDGADMRIKRGADMRIKRGADLGCFLCKLSLNPFRKHVIVLDKTEFRCDFSSDLNGLGNFVELLSIFRLFCLKKVKRFLCKLKVHFLKMIQIKIMH